MNGEVGDQPRLTISDGTVLALSDLHLPDIVGGLALQKRESIFTFRRNQAPVFERKITAMVAHLLDFGLKLVCHGEL